MLLKDASTLEDVIACARTIQHIKPTQPSSSYVVINMVSNIISEKLSVFATNINSMQFNNPKYGFPSPRRVHIQSPEREGGFREALEKQIKLKLAGSVASYIQNFNALPLTRHVTFVKRTHFACICFKAKVQNDSGTANQ